MRFRFRLRQHLGVPVTIEPAGRAEDWLQGQGDLLIAGMGGRVPLAVQVGVLAHADLNRLADLGRHSRLDRSAKPGGQRWPASPVTSPTTQRPPSGSPCCNAICWCHLSSKCSPAAPNSPPVPVPSATCEAGFPCPGPQHCQVRPTARRLATRSLALADRRPQRDHAASTQPADLLAASSPACAASAVHMLRIGGYARTNSGSAVRIGAAPSRRSGARNCCLPSRVVARAAHA